MDDQELEFLKLEYGNLREEIESISKELRDTERYTAVIIAAIWVWLATQSQNIPPEATSYFWWLPVFVVFLGVIRFFGVQQSLTNIAKYIATSIEPKFLAEGRGWENYLKKPEMRSKTRWWLSSYLLWIALFLVTLSVALLKGT
jgi:hypothetical protein